MRKLFNPMAGVFLMALCLFGCGNDDNSDGLAGDENLTMKNHFKVGNTEYELSDGLLRNYGQSEDWHEGYNLDLILVSKDLKISTDEEGYEEINGTGDAIYFELFTSEGLHLDNGDYVNGTSEFFPIGTYDYASYYIGIDTDEENEDYDYSDIRINSGKVTVKRTGQEYELTIDCTDENGTKVTGYYKGNLHYFDPRSYSSSRMLPNHKKRW